MKIIILFILLLIAVLTPISVVNAAYVRGYTRSNGTYVKPYYRSNPNGLRYDNYSYKSTQPRYNSSYNTNNSYKWNTPSWSTQNDYYSGLNSYNSNY